MPDPLVRIGRLEDVPECKAIADSMRQQLGFVRRPALMAAAEIGELLVVEIDSVVVGFCHYHLRRDRTVTVYEIAVVPERQGCGLGRELIAAIERNTRSPLVRARCPVDSDSNGFYAALGFAVAGVEPGKRRPLNRWERLGTG